MSQKPPAIATTHPNNQDSSLAEGEIDFGQLIGTLIDARNSIALITVLFAMAGVLYAIFSTPIYKADALVQVEEKSSSIPGLSGADDLLDSPSSSEAEIELIKSRMVIGQAVDDLGLDTHINPERFPIIGEGLSRLLNDSDGFLANTFTSYAWGSEEIKIENLQLDGNLFDTRLDLIVTAAGYDIYLEDQLLLQGTIGQTVNKNGISIKISDIQAKPGIHFKLIKQTRLLAIQYLQQELDVNEKGNKTGILQLTLQGQNSRKISNTLDSVAKIYFLQNVQRMSEEAEQSLEFLQNQLPEVKEQLNVAERELNIFRQENDSVDLTLETQAVLEQIVTLERQITELEIKEAELSRHFKKAHPAYQALIKNKNTLEQQKHRLEESATNLPETQQEILRLTRDVEVSQEIYLALLNNSQELKIMKAGTVGYVRIIDTAQTQPKPVKPKKALSVLITTVIGAMFGMLLAFVKTAINRGVENPDDIEALGLPVYASIPLTQQQTEIEKDYKNKKELHRKTIHETLLALNNPADLSIEALRSLRTSLHFATMEAKNNCLMISSPSPDMGKSFISANLSAVVAGSGQRVLLIDADMRKGHLQRQLCAEKDPGLSNILSGQTKIADAIQNSGHENLDFIASGPVPPNPSELLMHTNFTDLIEWASKNYDLVLLDTPPILAVTDPAIIGQIAGTALMIARFGESSLKEIETANKRFEHSGINIKGCILNACVHKASGYYGGYSYYQYSYKDKDSSE